MSRRGAIGGAIVVAWILGLGLLARRELFRDPAERLAEAAMRVAPETYYYLVERDGQQIGFASSAIDTTTQTIEVSDQLEVDLPVDRQLHGGMARSAVSLSRGLRPRTFRVSVEMLDAPIAVSGRFDGDSLLHLVTQTAPETADSQTVTLAGPIVLPTLVPLLVGLTGDLEVGTRVPMRVLWPGSLEGKPVEVLVAAESVFVAPDSAKYDSTARRWTAARMDTIEAWRLELPGSAISGWVDHRGRIVEATQPGVMTIRRTAYEIAFENWRLSERERASPVTADRDILESTAIAASAPIDRRGLNRLRVRLGNVDLAGFDLAGHRQTLTGDTLRVVREHPSALEATYRLPMSARGSFRDELRSEPLLQSRDREVAALARRIAGGDSNPRIVAERLNRWVHDSLRKRITVGVPNALQVLRTRSGDCNEHTQLYVALARSLGLPSRSAAGLALVRGKFYYHAWPEVYLGDWVAVDPTFGQFPADAAHLRFIIGGLTRQADLLRLIGRLEIEVIDQA